MPQQEIRVPDFSKRLTTERGRIEHNNPGPGERTSIGPEDRALLMESHQKSLTAASEPAKVSETVETPVESQEPIPITLASESPESSTSEPGSVSDASETPQTQASDDDNV